MKNVHSSSQDQLFTNSKGHLSFPVQLTTNNDVLNNFFFGSSSFFLQKSFAFLYTNNENTEREIKKTIPFTMQRKE